MLTANQLRQVAARSGARDIANVEIDVILTYLLQLFHEKGLTDHLAFKGGTMLRKMVFGSRGRLSTDLDFTCRTDIDIDDLAVMMLDALAAPKGTAAPRSASAERRETLRTTISSSFSEKWWAGSPAFRLLLLMGPSRRMA